jgi:hypothetical protein
MIRIKKLFLVLSMFTAVIVLMTSSGCKKDSTTPAPARSTTYVLKTKDVLGVTGKVTLTETTSSTTTISITLTGASAGSHPAGLYSGPAVDGGGILRLLTPIEASGTSSTIVDLSYTDLIAYDGYIKVLKSSTEPTVIIAQGDIGGNVITTTNKSYTLTAVGASGVSGTALFEKRVNGHTLVTLSLTGVVPGQYPASINLGSIASIGGGPVKKELTSVEVITGSSGVSFTDIRSLDDLTPITFDNWLVYDGYINVYQTSVSTDNIICHGNIGSN